VEQAAWQNSSYRQSDGMSATGEIKTRMFGLVNRQASSCALHDYLTWTSNQRQKGLSVKQAYVRYAVRISIRVPRLQVKHD